MGKMVINGVTIDVPPGSNVNCINGVVYVNGSPYDGGDGKASGIVKIEIQGDPADIRTDYGDIEVHGNVHGKVDAGGSVTCGDVSGDVDAGGSARCGNVQGSVDAGGSVTCENVGGDVDAGGSIKMRR